MTTDGLARLAYVQDDLSPQVSFSVWIFFFGYKNIFERSKQITGYLQSGLVESPGSLLVLNRKKFPSTQLGEPPHLLASRKRSLAVQSRRLLTFLPKCFPRHLRPCSLFLLLFRFESPSAYFPSHFMDAFDFLPARPPAPLLHRPRSSSEFFTCEYFILTEFKFPRPSFTSLTARCGCPVWSVCRPRRR